MARSSNTRALRWLTPLGAALSLSCATTLSPPTFERFDLDTLPGPQEHPDAPAVVVLDRGELALQIDPQHQTPLARLRRLRRVRILRPSGVERFRRIVVPVEPTTRVLGLRVRTTGPDGRTHIADRVVPSQLNDLPAQMLTLDGIAPGTVVETIYDTWFTDLRFIPPWRFEADIPTRRSEYAVVVPEGFSVDLRFSEDGAFVDRAPDRFETPSGVRFAWSLADLPARYEEEDMPSAGLLSPRAHVVYRGLRVGSKTLDGLGTWDDVGVWLLGRQPTWSVLDEATQAEAKRVAGDVGDIEKALRILEIVARDIPNESEPPPPLWRASLPHPNTVLSSAEANPTSRGLLLVALLRSVGLPAVPALYARRSEDILLPDLPTLRSLEGIAAAVPRPEGMLVFDPSSMTVSAAVPPPQLQDQRVVLLREDIAEVARVPTSEPEDSLTETVYTLRLHPRGDVFGKMQVRLTGAEAGTLRARLLDARPDAYAEIVRSFLADRGASLGPSSVSIADLRVLRRPLLITGTVDARGLITGQRDQESRVSGTEGGDELFVPLDQLLGRVDHEPREIRRASRHISHPRAMTIQMTLTLPDGWRSAFAPPVESLEGPGRSVQLGARAETERRFGFIFEERVHALRVPTSEHEAWRRYQLDRRALAQRTFGMARPPVRSLEY